MGSLKMRAGGGGGEDPDGSRQKGRGGKEQRGMARDQNRLRWRDVTHFLSNRSGLRNELTAS